MRICIAWNGLQLLGLNVLVIPKITILISFKKNMIIIMTSLWQFQHIAEERRFLLQLLYGYILQAIIAQCLNKWRVAAQSVRNAWSKMVYFS